MSPQSFDWLAHHADVRPTKEAVIDLGTKRRFTWAEVNDRTSRLAAALTIEFGIGDGDRVAVLAHNNSNLFEVQFACLKLGAIMVPLNWRLAVPELEFIVGDASPTVLIHDDPLADVAAQAAKTCGIDRLINWDGPSTEEVARVADYEDLIVSIEPLDNPILWLHDQPVTIMYTSGTTGRPKGAIITQGMVLWNAINSTGFFKLGVDMTNLAFLPLFHTGGLNCFANPAFHYGGRNIHHARLRTVGRPRLHDQPRPRCHPPARGTGQLSVHEPGPRLRDRHVPDTRDLRGRRVTDPGTADRNLDRQGSSPATGFRDDGDLTDGAGVDAGLGHNQDRGRRPAGHAHRGPPGRRERRRHQGVRRHRRTVGAWTERHSRLLEPTRRHRRGHHRRWLHTGDAARRDDDGYYHIIDRWKDMYISGGENVYPAEVESVLYQLPEIAQVSVIGVPDDKWVEVGRACVVLKEGRELTEQAIIAHCRANLARFKVPQSVVFLDEIPHNATGKVLKRELRRLHGGG